MQSRISELADYFEAQRATLRAAVAGVPAARRDTSPAPGRWSVAGVVEHVAFIERRVVAMLGPAIAEARAKGGPLETAAGPILPVLGVDAVVDRSHRFHAPEAAHPTGLAFTAAWAQLEAAGDAIRAALRDADGLALGELSAPHPLFGPLNFYQWFAFLAGHEARHAAQIVEDAHAPARSSAP